MNKPKSIYELFTINQLCYFMIRNAFMSERRLTKKEREEYLLPIAEDWANRIFIEGKYDHPDWVSIIYESFQSNFDKTNALKILNSLELNICYSKVPTVSISGNKKLTMNVALMAFLMQINYSYIFFI